MAEIIQTTGTVIPLYTLTLDALQQAVGGMIELVFTTTQRAMYINEDGKIFNLPLNPIATSLYQYGREDAIYGDVVLLTHDETASELGEE